MKWLLIGQTEKSKILTKYSNKQKLNIKKKLYKISNM